MKLKAFDQNDLDSLALCAWKEARGEGPEGMRAVMHVIAHRAARWYGDHSESVHNAVYGKNQFTSMSVPSDPNFNRKPAPVDPYWQFCVAMAPAVCDGTDPDPTNGALYYCNLETADSGWFAEHIIGNPANHPKVAQIGHHTFYA